MPAKHNDGLGDGGEGNPHARGTAAWVGWKNYPEMRRGTASAADQTSPVSDLEVETPTPVATPARRSATRGRRA